MKKRFIKISLLLIIAGLGCFTTNAQEEQEVDKVALAESANLTYEANRELSDNKFVEAEVDYRRAISKSDKNVVAPYNLGNAYYNNESYSEAFGRFKEAGELSEEKPPKHKAYHNMGNVFMKNKEYAKAVEAYKEALRNDPTDEETRYNLALAKEMLKKQQDEQKNDDNKENEQQDQDQKEDQNQGEEEQDDQQDKGEDGEDKDEQKDQNKKEDGDEQKEKDQQPNEGDDPKKENKPRPNQLSPQQIENLLEAMQNEEKKVQEKMEAKKVKGIKQKTEKDW
ncbi:MAG: tetratricopeptide repeat protein [Flavobacteriaceae bacterium]